MAYVALYRQWRPQDFDNLIGQEHISTTLRNAINTGKIAHAYLFNGPRGTGKTSTAKILAKALNCVQGPTPNPCNQCPNCERITAGTSMDVFEIDAASNRGIDEIRDLREAVKFAPVDGRYKVYIIDEVHMLTTEAFNALLKTLEEPPSHVVFVLATTEPHKIPATIHSRCQRYDFRRIPVAEIESRLSHVAASSGLAVEADALKVIAVHADGGLRDALSILDQCAALGESTVTAATVRELLGLIGHEWVWRLTESLADRDNAAVLLALDELVALGKDVRQLLLELSMHIRSLMLYKAAPEVATIEMYSDDREVLTRQSAKFSHEELAAIIRILQEAANEAKWAAEPRITVELALLEVCRRDNSDVASLVARIAALEQALAAGMARPANNAHRVASPAKPENTSPKTAHKEVVAPPETEATDAAPSGNLLSDPQAIWEAVLKELVTTGKRSIHACVAQGQLVSLSDNAATIQFSSPFAKERTEKEDYRKIIEKIMAQVSGHQIKISCILGAANQPKEKSPPPTPPAASRVDNPVLSQAMAMFGGKVIKEDKNEEAK